VWRVGEALGAGPDATRAARAALVTGVAAVVVTSLRRTRGGLRAFGLAPAHARLGWGSAAAFTALAAAALAAAGALAGSASTATLGLESPASAASEAGEVLMQQLLLQSFAATRLWEAAAALAPARRLRVAAAAAAALFALLHAPNPGLMALAAAAGAFWTRHFLVHRNLAALVASHLVLAEVAQAALGEGPLLGLRVGAPALEALRGR
jgi:hypothetical protein